MTAAGEAPLSASLEAVLFVADQPLTTEALSRAAGWPPGEVQVALADLSARLEREGRGWRLHEVAGGWRLLTADECAPAVERLLQDGQTARLSHAALETLAVIAYRQPITRARVGAIRGVNVDAVMRTLLGRGLVTETGHEEGTGAALYRTTPLLLERLGLRTLSELPPLAPMLGETDDLEEASG